MSAVKAIRALLVAHAPVAAIVGTRIYAGLVPEGATYPALHIKEISCVERLTVGLDSESVLVTSRVQVTAIARSYPECKALLKAAKLGNGSHRGTIAGVAVDSITRQPVGPDFYDYEIKIFEQSRDFMIVFTEPN